MTDRTEFEKAVKHRLIDLGKTQVWLMSEVSDRTGLYIDTSYLYKILKGRLPATKIVNTICEVLEIEAPADVKHAKK